MDGMFMRRRLEWFRLSVLNPAGMVLPSGPPSSSFERSAVADFDNGCGIRAAIL